MISGQMRSRCASAFHRTLLPRWTVKRKVHCHDSDNSRDAPTLVARYFARSSDTIKAVEYLLKAGQYATQSQADMGVALRGPALQCGAGPSEELSNKLRNLCAA